MSPYINIHHGKLGRKNVIFSHHPQGNSYQLNRHQIEITAEREKSHKIKEKMQTPGAASRENFSTNLEKIDK